MCPAVVTAVLLVLLVSVTARPFSIRKMCLEHPDNPCSEGWSRIDEKQCATYIQSQKTFHEAQEHCRTLNSSLVSLHGYNDNLLCLTWRAGPCPQTIWIGAQISEGAIRNTNGSEFNLPLHVNACIYLRVGDKPWVGVVRCSKKKNFVCAKNIVYHRLQEWMGNSLPPEERGWRIQDPGLVPIHSKQRWQTPPGIS